MVEIESFRIMAIGHRVMKNGICTGIFLGIWQSKEHGLRYNIIAAPENLTDISGKQVLQTYHQAIRRISSLRNWHGYDGCHFGNQASLYLALKSRRLPGGYDGEWFIPTQEILMEKLYRHKDLPDIAGIRSFENDNHGSDQFEVYGTSSEQADNSELIWCCRVTDGIGSWREKNDARMSFRPCRAVPSIG